ncbi:putative E3 ubiquitin-protein ligase RBBP6 family [Helianthus anomalus]
MSNGYITCVKFSNIRLVIVCDLNCRPKGANEMDNAQQAKSNFSGAGLSVTNYLDGSEYDEFGSDLYEIPEVVPVIFNNNQLTDTPAPSKADEDSKIQALIDTPALDWQQQNFDGFGGGRGFGRGMGGRMGARGFGNYLLADLVIK